jgi:uncharacterized protein (DUF2062 family)
VKLERTLQYLHLRFVRIRSEPEEMARGLAVGVFAGLTPLIGFHMFMALALALVFRGNKFMAVLSCWIGNPVTLSFFFLLEYRIGRWILGPGPGGVQKLSLNPEKILQASWSVFHPTMLGSILLGLVAAVAVYFASLPLIRAAQRQFRRH